MNQDGTINSASNPAKPGSIVSLYVTGVPLNGIGLTDGSITPLPPPLLTLTTAPAVLIGGLLAQVNWAGPAPGLVLGATQINVQIPGSVSSGAVPVQIQVGSALSQTVMLSVGP